MNEIRFKGGAKIGRARISLPFATLKASKDKLELDASIIGHLVFRPQDILALEPYYPSIGWGIKIYHRVSNYKRPVIFWTLENPEKVIEQIKRTGLFDGVNSKSNYSDLQILELQKQGEFPFKESFAILFVFVWNMFFVFDLPFIKDRFLEGKDKIPFGDGIITANTLLFITALLSLISPGFRRLILKEGRSLDSIRKFIVFVIIISGTTLLFMIFGRILNP